MSASARNPTALITGASVGIGLELAKEFAAGGHDLVLTARNQPKLEELAEQLRAEHRVAVSILPSDLSRPEAPVGIFNALAGSSTGIDVLVNNAGFGNHGPFAELDVTQSLAMLQVNIVALTHLTRLFLPGMIERHSGKILNVASTAAFQPGPYMSIYYASKAYVLSFSEALAEELRGSGIGVTALCPGPTITEFQKRAGIENTPLFQNNTMTAQAVARAGYAGLMRGKRIVIPGLKNRLLATAARFGPRGMVTRAVAKLNKDR
jgi:uncharacterized protein